MLILLLLSLRLRIDYERDEKPAAVLLLLLLLPLFTCHDVLKSSNYSRMGRLNNNAQYNKYSMQSDWKVSACVWTIAYYYKILCVIVYRYENARFFFFQTTLELLRRSNIYTCNNIITLRRTHHI